MLSSRQHARATRSEEKERGARTGKKRVACDLRKSWENLGNPITGAGSAADWLAVGAAVRRRESSESPTDSLTTKEEEE